MNEEEECPLRGRFLDNASTTHKFLGSWDMELVKKRDSMPLKFYFVTNQKDELPVNKMSDHKGALMV